MTITFHGAARTVTGSKHLITLDNGFQILLDCGMFQGLGARTHELNNEFGFKASDVNVLLLSHAHIDHSGLIPKLVAEGFKGEIFCTQATRDLVEILLLDSAGIQAHYADEGHPVYYTIEQVKDCLQRFKIISIDEWFECLSGVNVLYTEAGHLAGSAAINLRINDSGKECTICFSGDVGRARHPLLKPVAAFPQAEYIILESTYGDRYHQAVSHNVDELLKCIKETCLVKQGKLIIPAFSVGRTQELLFMLNQLELERRLPDLKYFVDSPLSIKSTEIIKSHTHEFNDSIQKILEIDEDPFHFKGLKNVETAEDSKRVTAYDEPCVIISSSGMADAGRVRHHIHATVSNPKNTILFSGYCSRDSLGGHLLEGAHTVSIFGDHLEVKAEIKQLKGLSAHGDSNDLLQFVACQDPGLVRGLFLVHGEFKVQEIFSSKLAAKGFHPVTIPDLHEAVTLHRAVSALSIPAE